MCTELKVTFRRAKVRADKSARIAIERFVLVPDDRSSSNPLQ